VKNLKKLVIVSLLVLTGISGKIGAYTFKVSNQTDSDVKIKLYWGAGSSLSDWATIKKDNGHTFSWGFPSAKAGLCLNGIKVQKKQNGKWQKAKNVKLVRQSVPAWGYGVGAVAGAGIGVVVAGFVEAGFQCGNQDFDLKIDKAGNVVAVKK